MGYTLVIIFFLIKMHQNQDCGVEIYIVLSKEPDFIVQTRFHLINTWHNLELRQKCKKYPAPEKSKICGDPSHLLIFDFLTCWFFFFKNEIKTSSIKGC